MRSEEFFAQLQAIDDEVSKARNRAIANRSELCKRAREEGLNHNSCIFGCTVAGEQNEFFKDCCYRSRIVASDCPCSLYQPDNALTAFVREHKINSDTLYFMLNQFNADLPTDLSVNEQNRLIEILSIIHNIKQEETKNETEEC